MKTFMLVAMLIGLLITMWLVMRDVQEQTTHGPGPTMIKPIERAANARRTVEAADQAREKQLDGAARD